ncbi:hypothetical protein N431DRAFT_556531 [Stipitochalara longipes BDJ]|nr:hypothetical protein N431DRAFT_556531 [Stipitochalara longipes BDJ]
MLPQNLLIFLLGVVSFVEARPSPLPRVSFSLPNATTSTTLLSTSTSPTLASVPSSTTLNGLKKSLPPSPDSSAVCCFVIQDTISEEWWEEFSTSTTYGLVTVTSVTTYFSKGSDGLGTIFSSNSSVTVTNTSFVFEVNTAVNPLATLYNPAPGPTEDGNALGGSATMTGGVLVKSPEAFYVYNSVKIITAAAITNDDGKVVCAAASSGYLNINSNAEAYFGGPSIAGISDADTIYTTVITSTLTFLEPTVFTTTPTMTETLTTQATYYTNSDGSIVTPSPDQPGLVISLTTPFIYQPPWGSTQPTAQCKRTANSEQYGYIPQTLLNYLIKNPFYSSQYPGLASCVPGGPSLLQGICPFAQQTPPSPLPSTVAIPAGGGLTSGTTIYTMPNVVATPAPPSTPVPDMQRTNPPVQPPSSNPWPNPTPNPTPDLHPPPALTQNPPPNSLNGIITSILNNPPPPSPPPSGLFSTSILSGTPILVIPPTTIPLSLAPPALSGSTTTISGTPYLVIPSATSIPIPNSDVNEPIETTTINGTPYALIPSPSLSQGALGILTTVSGTPELILTGPMTVPLGELTGLEVEGSGRTTVIGGVTEVVLTSGMIVGLQTSSGGGSGSAVTTAVTSLNANPAATTAKNGGQRLEAALKAWAGFVGVMILMLVRE